MPTRILAFARQWRHYGGGTADDILVEFGITAPEYFRRLQLLLNH